MGWLELPPPGHPLRPLTLDVQLGGVLGEALQADLLPDEGEELFKGRAGFLVVVHLFLRALAGLAVEDAHFVLPAELQRREQRQGGRPDRDGGGRGTEGAPPGCWAYVGVQCRSQRRKEGWGRVPSVPLPPHVSREARQGAPPPRPDFLHKVEGGALEGKTVTLAGFPQHVGWNWLKFCKRQFWRAQWGRRCFLGEPW